MHRFKHRKMRYTLLRFQKINQVSQCTLIRESRLLFSVQGLSLPSLDAQEQLVV